MLLMGNKVVGKGNVQAEADEVILQGALTAATTTAVGGVLKIENDFGMDLIITEVYIDVQTVAGAANTVDIGVDDGGDVSSDNLIDGLAVGVAAGVFSNHVNGGTNGGSAAWKKGEFIVATASATLASLVGKYLIKARPRL